MESRHWDRCSELCPWRDWAYLSELQLQGNAITVEEKEKRFSHNFSCPGFVLNFYCTCPLILFSPLFSLYIPASKLQMFILISFELTNWLIPISMYFYQSKMYLKIRSTQSVFPLDPLMNFV